MSRFVPIIAVLCLICVTASCRFVANNMTKNSDGSLTVISQSGGRECSKTFPAGSWEEMGGQVRVQGVPLETMDLCR